VTEHEWYVTCEATQGYFQFVPRCSCGWAGHAQRQHLKGKKLEDKAVPERSAAVLALDHSRRARGKDLVL
jgi:hypothetical protein